MEVNQIHHIPIRNQQCEYDDEVDDNLDQHRLDEVLHFNHPKCEHKEIKRIFVREDNLVKTTGYDKVYIQWVNAEINGNFRQRLGKGRHHCQWGQQEVAQEEQQPRKEEEYIVALPFQDRQCHFGNHFTNAEAPGYITDRKAAGYEEYKTPVKTINVFVFYQVHPRCKAQARNNCKNPARFQMGPATGYQERKEQPFCRALRGNSLYR